MAASWDALLSSLLNDIHPRISLVRQPVSDEVFMIFLEIAKKSYESLLQQPKKLKRLSPGQSQQQ